MRGKFFLFFVSIYFFTGCVSSHRELLYDKKPGFYSYIVEEVKNGHVDEEHDADVYVTPASCQKTVIALLAYKTLGSEFRYQTQLYVSKKNDTIRDVIISFSGDPTLKCGDLKKLLNPLSNSSITGRVILDASLFQTSAHSENIMRDDVGTSYGQPVSSMCIDNNLIFVKVASDSVENKVLVTNDCEYQVLSHVAIGKETAVELSWENNVIVARGTINGEEPVKEFTISPPDIDMYMKMKVNRLFKELAIQGKVEVVRNNKKIPQRKELLNVIESETLREIIPPALKMSDNLVFDSLYLKIINMKSPGIRSWSHGDAIIKALIKDHFGVDMGKAFFVDGSGLSRYNRVQPRRLVELLRRGYDVQEFVAAFPAPGEHNTTLEKRNTLPSNVRAKTGSMTGISCLCGYVQKEHDPKVFAFFASGFAPPLTEMYGVQDSFMKEILSQT